MSFCLFAGVVTFSGPVDKKYAPLVSLSPSIGHLSTPFSSFETLNVNSPNLVHGAPSAVCRFWRYER